MIEAIGALTCVIIVFGGIFGFLCAIIGILIS